MHGKATLSRDIIKHLLDKPEGQYAHVILKETGFNKGSFQNALKRLITMKKVVQSNSIFPKYSLPLLLIIIISSLTPEVSGQASSNQYVELASEARASIIHDEGSLWPRVDAFIGGRTLNEDFVFGVQLSNYTKLTSHCNQIGDCVFERDVPAFQVMDHFRVTGSITDHLKFIFQTEALLKSAFTDKDDMTVLLGPGWRCDDKVSINLLVGGFLVQSSIGSFSDGRGIYSLGMTYEIR